MVEWSRKDRRRWFFSPKSKGSRKADNTYSGMTVNERLFLSGLMDDFDRAVKNKAKEEARELLKKVDLDDDSIMPILKAVGLE